MSWECHRCHRVNAPHVNQCSCPPPMQFTPYRTWPPYCPTYPYSPYGLYEIWCTDGLGNVSAARTFGASTTTVTYSDESS